jgi:hypothetical protein
VTDRYCRNCGHELAETDRFCPNCGTPVHEAAHVPTPEADVNIPSPPKQATATAPSPDDVEGHEDFSVTFFAVVAAIGAGLGTPLLDMAVNTSWSGNSESPWAYLAFALFLGVLLPVVFGFAFGYSGRSWQPLPRHFAIVSIGTFGLAYIGMGMTRLLIWGQYHFLAADVMFVPVIAAVITAMFYVSSAFIGRAWRRQASEPSHTTVSVGVASDQPQTPRQHASDRLSEQNWTPRQQAMVGLIGTIVAALIGLFGVLIQVLAD